MFFTVNIRKQIVDSILFFIVNGIFGDGHPGLFLLNGHSFRCAWGNSRGGIISSKAAGCIPAVLVEVGSIAGVFQLFCLLLLLPLFQVNSYFGVTNPSGCLIILNTLFILILKGRKLFWRAPFTVGILINNWYYVSRLLNITSALELQRGFLHS